MRPPDRLRKPGYRYLAALVAVAALATAPRWTRAALHRLAYFHVRRIEIRGTRYLQPDDVVARLRVDTTRSIVDDVAPLEARLRALPQIAAVHITRRLPGTLVVTIRENAPVALVPRGDGLVPYDSAGRPLPIDPSRTLLDLPVLDAPAAGALALLGALRARFPALYARVSDVVPDTGSGGLVVVLTPALRVRVAAVRAGGAGAGVAADRFADIFPVESDLARRGERVAELDLRFRDQVVARLQ